MDLIANKGFKYRGRALRPDDEFTADRKNGRVLVATRRARLAETGTVKTPRPKTVTKAPPPRRNPMDRDGDGHTGGSLPASPPSLRGKSKAKLLEIADAEKVAIPDREASNSVIAAAIKAKRDAA